MKYEIPKNYYPKLNLIETEIAIKLVKDNFEQALAHKLNLIRVSAPLFVKNDTGLNDDLSGVERPVSFDVLDTKDEVSIVQSLAKWKRFALKRYQFTCHTGLYTDMNAIRRDEELDNIHSIYVDQWDWEKIIENENRTIEYLKTTVNSIYQAIVSTQQKVCDKYSTIINYFPSSIYFITSTELEALYPSFTPKQRENAICELHKAVFLMQIGDKLPIHGVRHDGRAPDYDDWQLNGDILVYYPPLNSAVELSSMGIRVNEQSLDEQLNKANCNHRRKYPYHTMLLNSQLPLTIGGGIGQSRLCLMMLNKIHIGEVQSSIWAKDTIEEFAKIGVTIL